MNIQKSMLKVNYQKIGIKESSIYHHIRKNKIPGNKPT